MSPDRNTRLKAIKEEMSQAGVQDPAKDISIISAYVSEKAGSREDAAWEDTLIPLLERRIKREPWERIVGRADFFEKSYQLTPNVFKPAFETETVVEHALIAAEALNRPLRILDLGTGTGCMLITLLSKLPHATGVGVDITDDAVALATQNAQAHSVSDRARIIKSDWTSALDETFDIIVSNPPRIPSPLISSLVKEVSEYDPWDALDGGPDGLLFYERLAKDFRRIATPEGRAFLQVGSIIAPQAARLFASYGYGDVALKTDYKYAPNCVTFCNRPEQPKGRMKTWLSKWGLR